MDCCCSFSDCQSKFTNLISAVHFCTSFVILFWVLKNGKGIVHQLHVEGNRGVALAFILTLSKPLADNIQLLDRIQNH